MSVARQSLHKENSLSFKQSSQLNPVIRWNYTNRNPANWDGKEQRKRNRMKESCQTFGTPQAGTIELSGIEHVLSFKKRVTQKVTTR